MNERRRPFLVFSPGMRTVSCANVASAMDTAHRKAMRWGSACVEKKGEPGKVSVTRVMLGAGTPSTCTVNQGADWFVE